MPESIIYTDYCNQDIIENIAKELNVVIYTRFIDEDWNTPTLLSIFTDTRLKLFVVNTITAESIVEITLADVFAKKVLVTTPAIECYPQLDKMITNIDYSCHLNDTNNTFISWYKQYVGVDNDTDFIDS